MQFQPQWNSSDEKSPEAQTQPNSVPAARQPQTTHARVHGGEGKKEKKKETKKEKHCNSALNSCRGSSNKEPVVSGVLESVLCLNTAVYRPAGVFKSMPACEQTSLY